MPLLDDLLLENVEPSDFSPTAVSSQKPVPFNTSSSPVALQHRMSDRFLQNILSSTKNADVEDLNTDNFSTPPVKDMTEEEEVDALLARLTSPRSDPSRDDADSRPAETAATTIVQEESPHLMLTSAVELKGDGSSGNGGGNALFKSAEKTKTAVVNSDSSSESCEQPQQSRKQKQNIYDVLENGSSSLSLTVSLLKDKVIEKVANHEKQTESAGLKMSLKGLLNNKQVKMQIEHRSELHELSSSITQFRNMAFCRKPRPHRGLNGIYQSQRRTREHCISPEEIVVKNEMGRKKNAGEKPDSVAADGETFTPRNVIISRHHTAYKKMPLKEYFRSLTSNLVLDRDSLKYNNFYWLVIFCVVVEALVVPYQFVFWGYKVDDRVRAFNAGVNLVYILDVYVSFHLTFTDNRSEVVTDLYLIHSRYIRSGRFAFDLIAAAPFDIIFLILSPSEDYEVFVWLSYLKIVKSFRLMNISRHIKRASDNTSIINFLRILYVVLMFFVIMHWLTCMWFQISIFEDDRFEKGGEGELRKSAMLKTLNEIPLYEDIEHLHDDMMPYFNKYSVTLNSVFMIMNQDNVNPETVLECFFAVFVGIFGMVVTAILIGQTADIIGNLHRAESRYRNRLDDMSEQLKSLDVDSGTKARVFDYLEYVYTLNRGLKREDVLKELSESLRSEVLVQVHGEVIQKIPFFDTSEIPELLIHLVKLLSSSYYLPGDVIVHEHEKTVDTSCMYFIVHGNVAVYHMHNPDLILQIIETGDFFGEISYLARGSRRTASLCAASNSDIASLRFDHIDSLIEIFPEMKPKMDSELKKHLANTADGAEYLKNEMKMMKIHVGAVLHHERRGYGVVVEIDEYNRRHVEYKNGEKHKYQPLSWNKMTLIKQGDKKPKSSEVVREILDEIERVEAAKRQASPRGSKFGLLSGDEIRVPEKEDGGGSAVKIAKLKIADKIRKMRQAKEGGGSKKAGFFFGRNSERRGSTTPIIVGVDRGGGTEGLSDASSPSEAAKKFSISST